MTQPTETQLREIAQSWLSAFENALVERAIPQAVRLFTDDGAWRDIVSFSWHIYSWANPSQIEQALQDCLDRTSPGDFRIDDRAPPALAPRAGREVIEFFFSFSTSIGRGEGAARLVAGPDGKYRAWSLLTTLTEIKGHEPRVGARRPRHSSDDDGFGGRGWPANRAKTLRYTEQDPTVLIVGAGQAGLSVAARLRAVGVDALVIDREDQLGDNWRRRYRGLRLHTETPVNHLPFLPFPPTAPGFMSGALFGDWLASYASVLELNVWTGTEFLSGEYDDDSGTWVVHIRRDDGSLQTLRPKHLVIATGLSDIPNIPSIKGIAEFEGAAVHSSQFASAQDYGGKAAVVFGAGTSGIDIAHDLYEQGASVKIVQRGPMTVVNLDPTALLQFSLFSSGLPTEICDLIANADPYPMLLKTHKELTKMIREMDRELIEGLEKAGFRTHYGHDETGNVIQYFRTGGGYYLNVGGAELISAGKIGIRQFDQVSRFVKDGIVWSDGASEPVDVVVFATGYKNPTAALRRWFGRDVAESIGSVWGFDEGGELRNMFKRTKQPGLWFIGGGVLHARSYSLYLALQIQACELGLITPQLTESTIG